MSHLSPELTDDLSRCEQGAKELAARYPEDETAARLGAHLADLSQRVYEQSFATDHLHRQLEELERARTDIELRCIATEQQFASVSTLFVASSRLPDSLDRTELLGAIQEIVANLVGCEEFAVLERHADGRLAPVHSMGNDAQRLLATPAGAAFVEQVAQDGALWVSASGGAGDSGITACVPLILGGRVTGVVVLFRLLAHKRVLAPQDRELLDLLGTRAALALHCARLETRFAGVTR